VKTAPARARKDQFENRAPGTLDFGQGLLESLAMEDNQRASVPRVGVQIGFEKTPSKPSLENAAYSGPWSVKDQPNAAVKKRFAASMSLAGNST
jgi:hypothetical protein